LVCLAALSTSGYAKAAPCGRPDVDLTFPAPNETAVPPNAQLSAHYASPARYDDEPVTLTDGAGNGRALSVFYDDAESMLRATPESALSAGYHELTWPGLRGAGGGSVGRGSTVSFFVQGEPDSAPPSFEGLSGIEWDLSRDQDPCLDGLQDRFVFRLALGQASDDRGTGVLSVRVFQTKDPQSPELTAPVPLATRAFVANGTLEVRRPATKAGLTCFAAVVQDSLGQVSGGGEREVCVKTRESPFFDGCTLSPQPRRPRQEAFVAALALLAMGLRLRRRGFACANG